MKVGISKSINGKSPKTFLVTLAFVDVLDGQLRFNVTQLDASWIVLTVESPKTKLLSCQLIQSTLLTTFATVAPHSNLVGQALRKTISNAGKLILEALVVPAAPIFSFQSIKNKGIEVK